MENANFTPPADPWALFDEWYKLALKQEPSDPDAMSLATAGEDGMPSSRIVLLKSYGKDGLVFFTNRQSRKGEQLKQNPKAGTCLHWKSLRRQIRAEGTISLADEAESDAYFRSRPRDSQIGAWASQQSRALASRAELENAVKEFEKRFEGQQVPRPPYWGGYRLAPLLLEFWQERPHRLHDRVVYRRANPRATWTQERIYP